MRAIPRVGLVRDVPISPGMRTSFVRRIPILVGVLALGVLGASRAAEAKGTFFLLEVDTGIGESAYAGKGPGLSFGASAGVTLRIPGTPLRYHLLGSVVHRGSSESGVHVGTSYSLRRSDLDVFAANRVVVPIWRTIRVYGELGLGTRFTRAELDRSIGHQSLDEVQRRFLLVTALGVQARVSKHFSVGLRGELVPIGTGPDLAAFAADLAPNPNRMSLHAQLGVHF